LTLPYIFLSKIDNKSLVGIRNLSATALDNLEFPKLKIWSIA